ncbi:MAG TPA: Bax inhibitor-1/YccA family protein [Thermoplasmata archaeon]|nr:Bax inhibitor-1/YccA family protein [Thermoplasmata archaeon]
MPMYNMRTSNPALRAFRSPAMYGGFRDFEKMSVCGTVNATLVLLAVLVITALFTWYLLFVQGAFSLVIILMIGGAIGGLVLAIVTIFKKEWSPFTAPAYAAVEGLFVGGISAIFELWFPGIVLEAIALTFGVFMLMLLIFKSGIIKVNRSFMIGVAAATGAIVLVYMASFFLSFMGIAVPYIHGSGPIGIGFSVIVVSIAALNLMLDFHIIAEGSSHGYPKYMDWYAAFALMVTLIWLYVEILVLLSKLRSR